MRDLIDWADAQAAASDPLLDNVPVYRDQGPSDTAANHDDYLYGGDA